MRPFVRELSRLIQKYQLLGPINPIDLQFSSSDAEVGKRLQLELGEMFEQLEYLNVPPTPSTPTPIVSGTTKHHQSSNSSNLRVSLSEEAIDKNTIQYNVVTDTVSFLPYIGMWNINDYNGLAKVVSTIAEPDGK